jgi:hypothetical protein
MTVEHRASRYARHVCPDCDAGRVWTAHPEPAPVPVRTAEDERAAVVAWLREQAARWEQGEAGWAALDHAAATIEKGFHRREGKPPA